MDTDNVTNRKANTPGTYVAIGMLFFAAYVLLYPAYAILEYFRFVSSDHGIGQIFYYFFMPLMELEGRFESVDKLFQWLKELYLAPFKLTP